MSSGVPSDRPSSGAVAMDATNPPGPVVRLTLQLVVLSTSLALLDLIQKDLGASPTETLDRLAWMATAQLAVQIALLAFVFGSTVSPPVVFSLLLSLFTSGWLILRAFGLRSAGVDVVGREATSSIVSAASFYLAAFAFYGLGVALVGQTRERSRAALPWSSPSAIAALRRVGAACVAVGVIPFVVVNANNIAVVLSSGYSAYYEAGSRLDNPLLVLNYFFVVGLVVVGASSETTQAKRICLLIVAIGAIRLLAGDRGEGITYLLTALLLWRAKGVGAGVPRAGRKALIALGAFVVIAIPAVGALRQSFGSGQFGVRAALVDQNPIIETLHTMGGTLFPLIKVHELVPAGQDYLNGATYLSGLLRLLPSWLLPRSLDALATEPLYTSPATWLMTRLGMSYGPGFTPFAEAYLNFGVWGGYVAMFVFGVAAAVGLRLPLHPSPFRLAFVIAAFALCGFSVRGSSNFLLPTLVRFVVLPLGIAALMMPRIRRRRVVDA